MTMNPDTGEGFDAVQVGEEEYFDPNALDDNYPGSLGLTMRKKTFWQGNVEFDTFEVVGPKFGPKWPDGTMKVSGLGTDADVWGLSEKEPPPPGYAPWLHNGVTGTNGGTNIFTPVRRGPNGVDIVPKHEWTPCFEDDGSPTLGEFEQRSYIDITLLGAYGGDIKFPVMPEEFGADFTHEYWTPRVVGLGEIIMPGGQSMETISWDSFFPYSYDSDFCCITPDELETPKSITARLIWTMRFKMDCMLIVGGGIWNDRVVITNFNYRHRAGEIDDIYYNITMKRFRAPVVSTNPNPDALWDRRSAKDPRGPVGAAPVETTPPADTGPPPEGVIPVEPDPPPPAGVYGLEEFPVQRESNITIETTTVLGQPATTMRDPGGGHGVVSETFQKVVARVSKEGPNTMANMLPLNQWVSDNNYNPYTSMLPIGSGVKYYKEVPVSAGKTTTLSPVGAVQVGEEIAKAWEAANNALRPPDWFTKPIDLWPILRLGRPDPSTVVPGGEPRQTPGELPRGGGLPR